MKGILFIVGFMGCGKSSKGKQLAAHLGCEFVDIDHEIVHHTGLFITDYFEKYGEQNFRTLEQGILKNFKYPEHCVVATGGGLPCFFDNMQWMNTVGTTIYLQMKPKELVARLHNRQKRPLIKDMDDEMLLKFIIEKLEKRRHFYEQANMIIDGFELSVENFVQQLNHIVR